MTYTGTLWLISASNQLVNEWATNIKTWFHIDMYEIIFSITQTKERKLLLMIVKLYNTSKQVLYTQEEEKTRIFVTI